ncbi:MAG TPA: HAMP domain-containing sensor histidine kinase [Frankiaceae bacterium]|nr:HAMP domain-containing sensor histidine kinase [Frankiaceae bacterium]
MDEPAATTAAADPYAGLLKELRGPVASIQSYVRTLIARDDDLSPSARSTIHQVILQQAQRLDGFVDDVVLYVRLLAGGVSTESEGLMLASVVEEVRHQLGEADRVVVTGNDAVLHTDRAALAAALRRLMRNALVYGPRQGSVTVDIGVSGGWAEVAVSDKGLGIPEARQGEALQPFTRALHPDERRKDGVGLGLSVARELVKLLGGEVVLRDNDPGLTALIRLPT